MDYIILKGLSNSMKIRKLNESYDNLYSQLRSDVYNALGNIAFKYKQKFEKEGLADRVGLDAFESAMRDAIRFFNDRFWEDEED